jgi:hypothetical protein
LTLEALAGAGHRIELVAPAAGTADELAVAERRLGPWCRPHLLRRRLRPLLADLAASLARRVPWTIQRHTAADVGRLVTALLASSPFDVVHAEQLQAWPQTAAAAGRVPRVLRAQNVESELWAGLARRSPWAGVWLRAEARRLARWEGRAAREAAATVALTARDTARLRDLCQEGGEGGSVEHLPAPFPETLEPAARALPGSPPVVLFGSDGWAPNRDQIRWFADAAWPAARAALPGAVLHVFGGRPWSVPGAVAHAAPADSREVFAPGAVLVVPLRVASGVRMKILEAWARGLPVVATPEAAAGLEARDGEDLLLARDGPGFAAALARLAADPSLPAALVAGGRASLRARHAPAAVAERLAAVYRRATGGRG